MPDDRGNDNTSVSRYVGHVRLRGTIEGAMFGNADGALDSPKRWGGARRHFGLNRRGDAWNSGCAWLF
jgi:hypothetical protein